MHSLPQAELCLKKLLPGDNLINQLPVISTQNHWCLRQIAFPSSSLGLGKKINRRGFVWLHRCLYTLPRHSLLTKLINVCVSKSARVVRACLHLISSPSNSALSVYSFIKPNHPTCCKPQSTLPLVSVHTRSVFDLKAKQSRVLPLCFAVDLLCLALLEMYFQPEATGFQWNTILKSLLIGLIINQFAELLKCENVDVGERGARYYDVPHSWRVTTQWDNAIGVFHWGRSLIGQAALIQNNDNVHHPVATGTTAVTAAPNTMCVYVCVCTLYLLSSDRSVEGNMFFFRRLLFNGYRNRCQKHPWRLFM